MLIPIRDEARAETAPLLTMLLIGLNITIYLFSSFGGALESMIARFGFTPGAVIHSPEVIFTSIFLHANLLHLISNMWFLWLYGDNVEDRLGKINYLLFYLLAGVLGNLVHGITTGFGDSIPLIGASGSVAGVMGCYMVLFPRARIRAIFLVVFYPIFFRIWAVVLLGGWMVFESVYAYSGSAGDNVAHWAHIGGFAFGLLKAFQSK